MRVRPALKGAEAAIREARHGRLTLTIRPIPRGGLDPASPSVLFVSRGRHRPFLRQEIPGSGYLEAWNVRPGARYHRAKRPCLLTHIPTRHYRRPTTLSAWRPIGGVTS